MSIAQDKYMWDEVLMNSRGSKDIVLGYFRGIGNKGKFIFMHCNECLSRYLTNKIIFVCHTVTRTKFLYIR